MDERTGFQRDCLPVIAGLNHPKGLAIEAGLDSYHSSEIYFGRLYPNLDTVIEKGFVEKGTKDGRTNADVSSKTVCERVAWDNEQVEAITRLPSGKAIAELIV